MLHFLGNCTKSDRVSSTQSLFSGVDLLGGLGSNALYPTWSFRIATAELKNAYSRLYSGKNYSQVIVNYGCPKQFFHGFALFCQLWLYFIFKLCVCVGSKPKTEKKPKAKQDKSLWANHPGLALVARTDSCELLQSSHREVAVVAVVEQADWHQGWGVWAGEGIRNCSWGDSAHGLLHPASPHPFQPSLALVRGNSKLFSPSQLWRTAGSFQGATRGESKKWGWQRYRINLKRKCQSSVLTGGMNLLCFRNVMQSKKRWTKQVRLHLILSHKMTVLFKIQKSSY